MSKRKDDKIKETIFSFTELENKPIVELLRIKRLKQLSLYEAKQVKHVEIANILAIQNMIERERS